MGRGGWVEGGSECGAVMAMPGGAACITGARLFAVRVAHLRSKSCESFRIVSAESLVGPGQKPELELEQQKQQEPKGLYDKSVCLSVWSVCLSDGCC